MKTTTRPTPLPRLSAALVSTLFIAGLSVPAIAAESEAAPTDHTLFVGLNLAVDRNGTFHDVSSATTDELTIQVDGKPVRVPVDTARNIRISKGVKLSTLNGTISNVKSEVVTRYAKDPQLEAMKTSMMLDGVAGDSQDLAQGGIITADLGTSFDPDKTFNPAQARAFIDQTREGARGAFDNSAQVAATATDIANNLLVEQLSGAGGEMIKLEFDVSSPQRLENAYVVVVAEYADAQNPKDITRRIATRDLGVVGSQPQKVRITQPSTVNGLKFKKFDYGLFADGQEVATNAAETQTQITANDAYAYFSIDYLAAHKGETRPPAPMLMTARSELRRITPENELDRTVYAKVDKTGSTVSLSTDSSGSGKVPEDVARVFEKVRFVPAIEKGVPVDGVAKVQLAQLVR